MKKASAPLVAEASRSDDKGAPHTVSGFYFKSETETMKPEAQRIAIAEECGYFYMDSVWHHSNGAKTDKLPDYLNDLNAMHEAEKVLTDDQKHEFEERLSHEFYFPTMTTSAQRAEAFLRTLNLWTDDT